MRSPYGGMGTCVILRLMTSGSRFSDLRFIVKMLSLSS